MDSESQPGTRNSYQERKAAQGNYITERHVPFLDIAFSFLTVILLAFSGIAFTYDFKWVGAYFLFAAAVSGICGLFVHVRHRIFGKRIPATLTLIGFTVAVVAASSIGSTLWYDEATKDRDSFNVVGGLMVLTSLTAAADTIYPETVLTPIDRLMYLRVTNKQKVPANIVGVQADASEGGWFSGWTKLCLVSLTARQIVHPDTARKTGMLASGLSEIFSEAAKKPVLPWESIAGFIGWECPLKRGCGNTYRVGISDAAGNVSWQVISPANAEIPANIQYPTLNFVESVTFVNLRVKRVCEVR